MSSLAKITTAPALTFDALVAGEPGAPLVLLLHGFAESMHCWRSQVKALAAAGYRAVAPSQRGYSPGARPDTSDTANYHIERLMDDAMAIADTSGYGERRFHLVGHDWGGSIAWSLADRYPLRLASLTVLSRPHPNSFNRALQMPDGDQAHRSRHHKAFLEPDAVDVVLADDARWLRDRLAAEGVPIAAITEHLSVIGNKEAMEAALTWYRARGAIRAPLGPIRVPTLYIWGDADDTVGRIAAEGTLISSPRPIASTSFPASDTLPPIRPRIASTNCCSSMLRPIRSDGLICESPGTSPPQKCCPAAIGARRHAERDPQRPARRVRPRTDQEFAFIEVAGTAKRPTCFPRRT